METRFWATTDPGRVREINEDNYLVDESLGLFVVCDGMGGHAAGEVASSTAARAFRDVLRANRAVVDRARSDGNATNRAELLAVIEFATHDACRRIHALAEADSAKKGMGTTLCALVIAGHRGYIAHVGDSRIYLLRHDKMHVLTEDHSLVNELIKRGRLTPDEIEDLPIKNAVTRAVGVYETVEVDTQCFEVLSEDRFLVCSDGLHNYFGEPDSLHPLLAGSDPAMVPRRAIDYANHRGGSDNITAIVVEIGEDDSERLSNQQFKDGMAALQQLEILRFLDYRELSAVMAIALRRGARVGEPVIEEGGEPALHIILAGSVWILHRGVEIGTLAAPQFFGLRQLLGTGPPELHYVAKTPTSLLAVPRHEFRSLLANEPELAAKLLWNISQLLSSALTDETLIKSQNQAVVDALLRPREVSGDFQIVSADAAVVVDDNTSASFEIDDLTHEVEMLAEEAGGEEPTRDHNIVDEDTNTGAKPVPVAPMPAPRVESTVETAMERRRTNRMIPQITREMTEPPKPASPQEPSSAPKAKEEADAPSPKRALSKPAIPPVSRYATIDSSVSYVPSASTRSGPSRGATGPRRTPGRDALERFARLRSMLSAEVAENKGRKEDTEVTKAEKRDQTVRGPSPFRDE